MASNSTSFRIGRVRGYRRGHIWYLRYFEHGKRRQPRVGPDPAQARQLASQINGQLEIGVPSVLGFQPISVVDLRQRWLDHHEHVRRSSLQTVRRYQSATQHLVDFIQERLPGARVADFRPQLAEDFVRYLRSKQVAPNGHPQARRRPLRDAGLKFILETCCALFNYAAKQRHLPPYADNPFRVIEVHRMPVEDARPVRAFTRDQEQTFLEACDHWQFPLFLALLFTGMRPGELVHLLLPDDLDLESGWLRIRNKPWLGWQVKTRNERDIPLVPVLRDTLARLVGQRHTGPVWLQRRCLAGYAPPLIGYSPQQLRDELLRRLAGEEASSQQPLTRPARLQIAQTVWRDLGVLKEDWLRKEFIQITKRIGLGEFTAPKTLRHSFATILQDANVDPLVRNELMGHAPAYFTGPQGGLGMTAIYTHTRPETKRAQLAAAFAHRTAGPYVRDGACGPAAVHP